MPLVLTRTTDEVEITVTGELDSNVASELVGILRRHAAEVPGRLVIDVARTREVTPVALAVLRHSELWPRMWLRGLSHNGERILRHLAPPLTAAAHG